MSGNSEVHYADKRHSDTGKNAWRGQFEDFFVYSQNLTDIPKLTRAR